MLRLNKKKEKIQIPRLALVLGEDSRSFLSVVRSLGKAGFTIHVVCYDKTSIALKSKYISSIYTYNYQSFSMKDWTENILCLIERFDYELIFPCDERAIYPLLKIKNNISSKTKLAITNQPALNILFDKWKTKSYAKKLNIPVAQGKLKKLSNASYADLKKEFSERFVIKPLKSFTEEMLSKRQKVQIINNEDDYQYFKKNNVQNEDYLIEEYFEGVGEGVAVFSWNGQIKAALSYRRLAEPYFGGGSSYRESIKHDFEQLNATKSMCLKTKLSGLAMFEFRRATKDNSWILVEVNARPWGGMPLAEFAGIDFTKLYADYLCGKTNTKINHQYRKVKARSLLTDLYEIKRESETKAEKTNHWKAKLHLLKRTANIARFVTSKESIDSFRVYDVSPFINEAKLIFRDILFQTAKTSRLISDYQRWKVKEGLKKELSKKINRKFIFICYGNIIRSPFAENYFKKEMTRVGGFIDTASFGFHKDEARPSPKIAITAAVDFNCDLKHHRSKSLYQLDINQSDILFYFDDKNKQIISSYYKFNQAYCLSDLLDKQHAHVSEIEDPYETDVDTVKQCYKKIQNAVDNLVHLHKEYSQ